MRNNFLKYLLIFSLTFAAPLLLKAQVNDAGLWASVNLEKKFSKKWSLQFSEEVRFYENITELGSVFSEISGEYRFNKMFSFSAGYRFTQKRQLDDHYSIRHRYLLNMNVKNKFGALSANLRIRYQGQYADYYSSQDGVVPSNYFRTKLSLKYDTGKKYTPFVSGEFFIHTNRADGMLLDNYRVAAGVEYELSKASSIELGYLINREVQVADPWTLYVITVGWNYTIK